MNYRAWQLKNADTAGESALLAAGYGPLLARVLACRGIAQPQAAAALLEEEPPLSDPSLLKDMDKAVARIQQAIENGETIVIFGDYDVDGVSATAILYECLTNLGAQVRCKLPTREGGGYGLNRETLQKLADKGYKLIVTVDNGISAIEEADLAAELGIDYRPPPARPAAAQSRCRCGPQAGERHKPLQGSVRCRCGVQAVRCAGRL